MSSLLSPSNPCLSADRSSCSSPALDSRLQMLSSLGVGLVVSSPNGGLITGRNRGVRDLFNIYSSNPACLIGADVTDKVIGRGAAALLIAGGIRSLAAGVISSGALDLFASFAPSVSVSFLQQVPHIVNRSKSGWCPVEELCRGLSSPQECIAAVSGFLASLPS